MLHVSESNSLLWRVHVFSHRNQLDGKKKVNLFPFFFIFYFFHFTTNYIERKNILILEKSVRTTPHTHWYPIWARIREYGKVTRIVGKSHGLPTVQSSFTLGKRVRM